MHLLERSGFTLFKSALNVPLANLVNRYCLTSVTINLFLTLNTIRTQGVSLGVPAICPKSKTPDGLVLANCSGSYSHVPKSVNVALPTGLGQDVEVIDLSNRGGLEVSRVKFLWGPTLSTYPKLKRVIQRNSDQFPDDKSPPLSSYYGPFGSTAMRNGFTNLDTLEYLEFSKCTLYEGYYGITFPKNLKTLNLSENSLTSLNLNMCQVIEEVNINWNRKLISAPVFHVPYPPVKALRMKGCPLINMDILDIAPLCELTVLELEFPPNTHYLTEAGYCQCVMLKDWIDKAKLRGAESLKCAEPKSKPACWDSTSIMKKAEKLRRRCPLLKTGNVVSTKAFSVLKYIFFSMLFLILLAILILYVIRHFHLREYWAAHHSRMAAMERTKMEEEEESLKNQTASSEDSESLPSFY